MRIANIPNYNINTSFKGWYKEVYRPGTTGKVIEDIKYTTSTSMFRSNKTGSNTWREITKELYNTFKDIENVKVNLWGCSDGREALTLKIALLNDYGYDFAKKLSPIKALDIDPTAICKAEAGNIILSPDEISVIERYTDGNFDKYFSSPYSYDKYNIRRWNINPILSSGIEYKLGDIFEEYQKITPNNNAIFIRNSWLYYDIDDRKKLAEGLASRVGKRSLIFIGDADREDVLRHRPADEFLLNAGFKPSKTDFVYQSPDF